MNETSYIQKGTKKFRKTTIAMFFGGFNTFAIMYSTQPLLPVFSNQFHISPAVASLSLSLTTLALAISMLFVGSLSEVKGRKPMMIFSQVSASVLAISTAFVPNYHVLLLFRVLQGIALAGLPAVAMAYLSEEIERRDLGVAMGLYVSGVSIGGMSGRIIIGVLTDFFNWRVALGTVGVLSVLASLLFAYLLPPSEHFQPRPLEIKNLTISMINHLKDPSLLCLYGIAFFILGSFVTLYNYIGFQLMAPPYSLSQTIVGFIFVLYIVGTFSSTWMGRQADIHGRNKMLWIGLLLMALGAYLTLQSSLFIKILGIALLTFGFFGSHSIASSWVGRQALQDKAQASSLYLFFYYAGSSTGGTVGGTFWQTLGWGGVINLILGFVTCAFLLSLYLNHVASKNLQPKTTLTPRKQTVHV
ncbi:arabinose efflux permease family protein [Desulfosporosinus acidiphilus SJ4]|uniref:Arabinose efflux permease family protein n=1 Tax=Desulfosporosinus acidiphilus (strain DSM 22704 / JCM 16185 / SJ4) TaxID=646529 RepID=I4D0R3_DESAJ|nr:MFS transporter [Desulfosporosinus acidiphilus]AFM39387.1 arabinose efflux permease family protein [Desulfosporosinus acidiphilus SJ4]